jgi:ankyrin repeat protein
VCVCQADKCDQDGWSAVMLAAMWSQGDCLDLLLKHGAKADEVDFHASVLIGVPLFLLMFVVYQNGWTSMMLAILNGHPTCLNKFVEAGVNVNYFSHVS